MARNILFLLLSYITSLNLREVMELFLDLYGNALIREKSEIHLDNLIPELIKFH